MATSKLTFETNKCKGCSLCVATCPKKILFLDKSYVNAKGYNPIACTDIDQCIACGMCAVICPDSIIRVEREDK